METLLAVLLNIVYGFLFFLAFGVLVLTAIYFSMAIWANVVRPLLRRERDG